MKTIFLTLVLSLAGRELWAWLPAITRVVIWIETLPLSSARRARRREEWAAHLVDEFDERRLAGLLWALQLSRVSAQEVGREVVKFALNAMGWLIEGRLAGLDRRLIRLVPPTERYRLRMTTLATVVFAIYSGSMVALTMSVMLGASVLLSVLTGALWTGQSLVVDRWAASFVMRARFSGSRDQSAWRSSVRFYMAEDSAEPRRERSWRSVCVALVVLFRLVMSMAGAYLAAQTLMLRLFNGAVAAATHQAHPSLLERLHALSLLLAEHSDAHTFQLAAMLLLMLVMTAPALLQGYHVRAARRYHVYL